MTTLEKRVKIMDGYVVKCVLFSRSLHADGMERHQKDGRGSGNQQLQVEYLRRDFLRPQGELDGGVCQPSATSWVSFRG